LNHPNICTTYEIGELTAEKIIRGRFLQQKTEELYTRISASVRVQSSENTSVDMGKPPDVKAGAMFCFAGFGTDTLRCQQAMKTARRGTPNCRTRWSGNRAQGAADQNRSCSNSWAAKKGKKTVVGVVFFLDFSLWRTFQGCIA
jgi:hypothetical protein